jgi:pimeloyl-ACP methyl ester carboxylesterase
VDENQPDRPPRCACASTAGRPADFPDPVAEAQLVAGRLPGTVAMIDQAGHYPQAEYPAETAAAILAFLRAELSTGRS